METFYSALLAPILYVGIYFSRNEFADYNEIPRTQNIELTEHPRKKEIPMPLGNLTEILLNSLQNPHINQLPV